MPVYPCPCCGRYDFGEMPGSYAICEVCCWEDCAQQLSYPAMGGGPNGRSLMEEQQIFAKGGSPLPLVDHGWRPLDPKVDVYLDWDSEEDHELLHAHWAEDACQHLYYWREDYWLRALRKPS